ncbi:MAG TPA: YdcF family protein [Bacillaceae bacterium]|nr:YdcF family protein [Bacillaceae bacterium]
MLISKINVENMTRQQISDFIFNGMEDNGYNGECIFVFGAKSLNRVKKAAKLFFENRAPFILVTGSGIRWGNAEISEAVWMKEHLIKFGVPENKVILETESSNTTENVVSSLFVLQRKIGLNHIKRILVVSSPFHMRRCLLTLKTYMPRWINYTICPDEREFGQKENWWETEKEKNRVLNEVKSIVRYINEGILLDEKVKI